MHGMEINATQMLEMVNSMNTKREQLEGIIASLPADSAYNTIKKEARALALQMKTWDDDMVQRKCKAYDDEENFPNKFTMSYIFLLNQTESDIPRVNQPSLDLLHTYNLQWEALRSRGADLLDKQIPALNKKFWEAGIGAIWIN
jgi:hypothetical protein